MATPADDLAVAQLDLPAGGRGDLRIVGDDDHGDAPGPVQVPQQGHDLGPGGLVQVAGGLVGEHHGGIPGQGPGDGDPLLLAAGQLAGPVPQPVAEADQLQQGAGGLPPPGGGDASVEQSGGHVLDRGQRVEQEELLEHDADPDRPQPGQLTVGQPG